MCLEVSASCDWSPESCVHIPMILIWSHQELTHLGELNEGVHTEHLLEQAEKVLSKLDCTPPLGEKKKLLQ